MDSSKIKRRIPWAAAAFGLLILAVFVASRFTDPIIRRRVEREMNQRLIGYQTRLDSSHLSFFDGTLSLYGLDVTQDAHPQPPVIKIPLLRIQIQWKELFIGRVVAECLISDPTASINLLQLRTEVSRKTPLKQEGWQQALQSIYPFKINKFQIRNGDVTYIDSDPRRPIRLEHLELLADNIRNIHLPNERFPSRFHVDTVMFSTGHAALDGRANFLDEPLPGFLANYRLDHVPLTPLNTPIERVNLKVKGGVVSSSGVLEYTPETKRAEVKDLLLDTVQLYYAHNPQTAEAEQSRIHTIKQKADTIKNKPGLILKLHILRILNSTINYENHDSNHHYQVYLSHLNGRIDNLSSHSSDGASTVALEGRFMGSGATSLSGKFRPEQRGPDFDLKFRSEQANLPSLNDFLRAYGRFDVQSGTLSVYSQTTVRKGQMSGYVKTLLSNIVVYDLNKDKNKPVLHQVYEMAIGGAAKLLRNHSTQQVATVVSLSGNLSSPNTSIWQALGELLSNAFVNAIRPGFDREISQASVSPK